MAVKAGRRFIGIARSPRSMSELARERIGRTQLQPALIPRHELASVRAGQITGAPHDHHHRHHDAGRPC